jgi:polysaccharide biosynthesis transport protein
MLQSDGARNLILQGSPPVQFASPAEILASGRTFVRRHLRLIVFVLLTTLTLAAIYLHVAVPRFAAQAEVVLDPAEVGSYARQSSSADTAASESSKLESEVEILKSEKIALAVIKQLRLEQDDEFVGYGHNVLGALLNTIAELSKSEMAKSGTPKSEFELSRKALNKFKNALTVRRRGVTRVIEVRFVSVDPEKAAQIANAVVKAYVSDQAEAGNGPLSRAVDWLEARTTELRKRASDAQKAVMDYKAEHSVVDSGGRSINEQNLADLNSQLTLARARSAEAKVRLGRLDEILRLDGNQLASDVSSLLNSAPNDAIARINQKLLDLSNREVDAVGRLGENDPSVIKLRTQLSELRSELKDQLRHVAETYRREYEVAQAGEATLQAAFSAVIAELQSTSLAQAQLRELESSAQAYQSLYNNFLQKYTDTMQQQSFPVADVRIIAEAVRPLKPSSPKTLLVLAVSVVGGTVAGIGAGILYDLLDRTFRAGAQVSRELRCDCVAVIPVLKTRKRQTRKRRPEGLPTNLSVESPRTIMHADGPVETMLDAIIDSPFSRVGESLRALKVAVDSTNREGKRNLVLGITSALPNEGKSCIAAGLAQLIAHSGFGVAVVDYDLRRSSLSRLWAPSAERGILDVALGRAQLSEVIWTDSETGLAFVPATKGVSGAHINDSLSPRSLERFVNELREMYDYVMVDLPPSAPFMDVRLVSHLFDSFIFVVEWGRTEIDVVKNTLGANRDVYENMVGVVLNKTNMARLAKYETYRDPRWS